MVQLAVKRLLDVVVCSVLLLVLLPFLVVIALVVKLSSPGPVFFVQERVGKHGRPFRMVKFRTMSGAPLPNQTTWSEAEEARITSVGRFLRAYGLDELPQLVNIIKGEMSIVGPRPPLPAQVNSFTDSERRMLRMRPGVTSLAAVQGRYALSPEQRRKLHVEYVDRWSLGLDLRILLHTIVIVLCRRNAAEPPKRTQER
jgi:lipopolysaccharide/colanic/teichoic acid biosynthesis glycosyltransferase